MMRNTIVENLIRLTESKHATQDHSKRVMVSAKGSLMLWISDRDG